MARPERSHCCPARISKVLQFSRRRSGLNIPTLSQITCSRNKTPLVRNTLGVNQHQPHLRVGPPAVNQMRWRKSWASLEGNPSNKQPLYTHTLRRLLVHGGQRSFCWHLVAFLLRHLPSSQSPSTVRVQTQSLPRFSAAGGAHWTAVKAPRLSLATSKRAPPHRRLASRKQPWRLGTDSTKVQEVRVAGELAVDSVGSISGGPEWGCSVCSRWDQNGYSAAEVAAGRDYVAFTEPSLARAFECFSRMAHKRTVALWNIIPNVPIFTKISLGCL